MDDFLVNLTPQMFWLGLGLLLCATEIVAPGFFLIWLGLAAVATGLITWALGIATAFQIALFGIFAIASVYGARRWLDKNPIISDDPLLNDRGARMVGDVVTVVEAIAAGQGRVKVGDTVWSARGPDTAEGAKVRIVGIEGAVLQVEVA